MEKSKEELVSQLISMSKILEGQINMIFEKEKELVLLKTKYNEIFEKIQKEKFNKKVQTEKENKLEINIKNEFEKTIDPKIHEELLEELIRISSDNKILKKKLLNKVKNKTIKKNVDDSKKKFLVLENKYEKIKNENMNLMALIKKSEYNSISNVKNDNQKLIKKNKKLKKAFDILKKEKIILQKSFSEFLLNIDNLKIEVKNQMDINEELSKRILKFKNLILIINNFKKKFIDSNKNLEKFYKENAYLKNSVNYLNEKLKCCIFEKNSLLEKIHTLNNDNLILC